MPLTLTQALAALETGRSAGQRSGETTMQRAARCVRFLGPSTLVSRVTSASARRMVLAMRETGLAPATVNRYLSALSALLEAGGAKVPDLPWQREPRGRVRWLSADELSLLTAAVHNEDPVIALLVRFLAETGLRVGEALNLLWEDVHLDAARPNIVLRRTKNGDTRWVPLTSEAQLVLRGLSEQLWAGPFHALSQSRVNHVFRAARESMAWSRGDTEIVPHCLRHTCASRLVRAGVSLPLVQSWLGHRDFRSTLRYVHTDEEGLAAAAQRLEDA